MTDDQNLKLFSYQCACCGEIHSGSPCFGYPFPVGGLGIPEDELSERVHETSDTCVIDDKQFYIRGLLEIPIHGAADPFVWIVWVSQSEASFDRYMETYDEDQSGIVTFGWLPMILPDYCDHPVPDGGSSLACDVVWRPEGERPLVRPHECDHPLYRDFAEGISWQRAIAIADKILHPGHA